MDDTKNPMAELERLRARVAELEARESEWKDAEKLLRSSQARLSGILNISEDAIISVDDKQLIRMFNRGAEVIFGYEAREAIGRPLDLLLPERARQVHRVEVNEFGKAKETARRMGERREISGRRKDGSEFPAEASISKFVRAAGEMVFTVVLRDISERKRKEEELERSRRELRRLTAHFESVREDESRRIAREVHDELGQWCTVLKMQLSSLAKDLENADPTIQQKVQSLLETAGQTMDTVRRIATELRPSLLDQLGLQPAIERHLRQFGQKANIETIIEFTPLSDDMRPDLSVALFRIYQEALTNVARHSGATRVTVAVEEDSEPVPLIRLRVTDNGKGFEPGPRRRNSLGLLGMKERALHLGGQVSVESRPGQGTTVLACIPLVPPAPEP